MVFKRILPKTLFLGIISFLFTSLELGRVSVGAPVVQGSVEGELAGNCLLEQTPRCEDLNSTCNTSSTWNGSNTLQCQKGVISWNNPRENKTIVFEQGGKPFNLCLTFRPFPFSNMSTFSVSTVRNREYGITIIYHPEQRSCFESYCGRVTLMLSTGKEKEIDVIEEPRRISLEFSTTILQQCSKCEETCMQSCLCSSQYVLAGRVMSSREQPEGNLYIHKVAAVRYFRYNGTFNTHSVGLSSNYNGLSEREHTTFDQAPRFVNVLAKCRLEAGHTYFLSASNNSTSSNHLTLSLCCMDRVYKEGLKYYNRLIVSDQCNP